MLRKLLKHEFVATGRVMWVIYVAMLGFAVVANLAFRLLDHPAVTFTLIRALLKLTIAAWVISLIVGGVATVVLMVKRFHKNLLTDEGYLMFTLPANVHQLVISKLIAAAVWLVATMAVIALSILIGAADEAFDIRMLFSILFNNDLTALEAISVAAMILEAILMTLLGCASSCLQFYSAMSIGHGFSGHKVLWSVVFYFIQSAAMQILAAIVFAAMMIFGETATSASLLLRWLDNLSPLATWHLTVLALCLIEVIIGAVFYALTAVNLKKRLNLA